MTLTYISFLDGNNNPEDKTLLDSAYSEPECPEDPVPHEVHARQDLRTHGHRHSLRGRRCQGDIGAQAIQSQQRATAHMRSTSNGFTRSSRAVFIRALLLPGDGASRTVPFHMQVQTGNEDSGCASRMVEESWLDPVQERSAVKCRLSHRRLSRIRRRSSRQAGTPSYHCYCCFVRRVVFMDIPFTF